MKVSSPSSSRTEVSLTQVEESEPGERGEGYLLESSTSRDPGEEEEGSGGHLYCKYSFSIYVHQIVSFPVHMFEFGM